MLLPLALHDMIIPDKSRRRMFDWQFMGFGLVILLVISLNQGFMWSQSIDAFLYDNQLQALSINADDDIVIVEIDEQSLFLLGDWPWPRSYHGEMIDFLAQAHAKVIAYNVVFASADINSKDDILLSRAIKSSHRTILPLYFDRLLKEGDVSEVLPAAMFREHAVVGHVNSYLDSDGILRSMRLVDAFDEHQWPHFSLISYLFSHPDSNLLDSLTSDVNIPFVNEKGFNTYSFVDVLSGLVPQEKFSQKAVFVGVTATSMGDPLLTPISDEGFQSPAVRINASIYQALKHNTLIEDVSIYYALIINFIIIVLVLYLISKLSGAQQVLLTLVGLFFVWGISYLLLIQGYWYRSAGVMVALIAIPFFWNILRLSRLFHYFRSQIKVLQKRKKDEVFHLPEHVRLKNEKELKALLTLLKIVDYRLLYSDKQASGKQPEKDKITIFKYVTLKIADKKRILELPFQEFGHLERRQLELLYQLLEHSTAGLVTPDDLHSNTVNVRTDMFSQQLALVESYQQQAEVSHSLFEASIEGISAGILVTDLVGRVLFKNKAFVELVGADIEALVVLFEQVPLLQAQWVDSLTDVVLSQKAITVEAKSANRDLSISIRCIEDRQRLTPLLVFNFMDITAIKQAHRSRNEMIDFLSHDLRSPMASLQALVNHARNTEVVSYTEIIDKVDHYSQRGLNFAEQFLSLAKVESEEDIQHYETDLYSVSQNAVDTLYHQGKEKSITLATQVTDDCWVMSNGDLLERILINLVSNAIKYSACNTRIDIVIDLKADDDEQLEIRVTDQGPGISAELLPNLFKPYQRGLDRNTQQAKGVGLGLRFVDVALKKLGSQVHVSTSTEGLSTGSSFYFYLPKIVL